MVINHLMELADARATSARLKADKVAIVAAARVSDLDQEETPESIMLSSMTEEDAKDRTDREVVVPWLKFLWESYRAILELLYKIPKLEKAYHAICEKAFKFCLEYNRVLEFKRLCDMLRMQLTNLQKTPAATARVRTQWEWTPDAVELHLKTRFAQLEGATTLELWNEGFRTVEDIYAIMVTSKKTPKAKLMMTYYDKLQKIFWVSDNKLFHAYAWFRYYNLCCETRKEFKAEEKSVLASSVLLSALTVPSTRDNYSFDDDGEEEIVEKTSQMAQLLDFQSNPSRQSLLGEIVAKGFLNDVLPELAALYDNLEVKFQPLALVQKVTNALAAVKAHPTLSIYAAPLQRVAVVKLMQQLGRVYSTVKLDFLYKLLSGFSDLSNTAIERILIEGVAAKQLQLRVNHSTRCIVFGAPSSSGSTGLDTQVSQLGSQLNKVAQSISLLLGQKTLEGQKAASRKEFLQKVSEASEDEYLGSLDRKAQIERRKEELERIQQERQMEERRAKEEEEANRKDEEARRLLEEENERNAEKRRKQLEKMELLRLQKELEKNNKFIDETTLAEMDISARRVLLTEAQAEVQKAKEEEVRKITEQARRLDHIARALRIEGAAAVIKLSAVHAEEDRIEYERFLAEFYARARAQHAADLLEKQRLSKMQALRSGFESTSVANQRAVYDKYVSKEKQKAQKHRTEQAIAKARRLYYEAQERAEAEEEKERERIAKEERARIELEEYERLRIAREAEKEREERMLREVKEAEEAARLKKEEELKNTPSKPVESERPRRDDDREWDRSDKRGPPARGGFDNRGGPDRDWSRSDNRGGDRPERQQSGGWSRDGGRDGGRDAAPRERESAPREGGGGFWRGSSGPSGPPSGGGFRRDGPRDGPPSRDGPPQRDMRDSRDTPKTEGDAPWR